MSLKWGWADYFARRDQEHARGTEEQPEQGGQMISPEMWIVSGREEQWTATNERYLIGHNNKKSNMVDCAHLNCLSCDL